MNNLGGISPGYTVVDLCGVEQSTPGVLENAQATLQQQVTPELEKHRAEVKAADDALQMLGNTQGEFNAEIAKDEAEFQPKLMSSWVEKNRNFGACDALALSESLRPLEYKLVFMRDARDLLVHKLIPAALLHKLESTLRLRKTEAQEANLLAFISHERTMQKAAGVFEEETRVAIVGQRTTDLRNYALECERRVGLAEEELRDLRKAQLTTEQQRFACHLITRAEAVASIPACAVLIA
jgi:hypothetical protein